MKNSFSRIAIALFTLTLAAVSSAQTAPQLVDDVLQAAIAGDETRAKEARERIDMTTKPAKGDRQLARGLNTKALGQLSTGEISGAVDTLYQAASADISDAEIASNLGYALLKAGRPDSAQKALISSINLQSWRAAAWVSLAETFAAAGDTPKATAALEIAFSLTQDREKLKSLLARYIEENRSPALTQAATTALAAEGIKPQQVLATIGAAAAAPPPAVVAPSAENTMNAKSATPPEATTATPQRPSASAAPARPSTTGGQAVKGKGLFEQTVSLAGDALTLLLGLGFLALILWWPVKHTLKAWKERKATIAQIKADLAAAKAQFAMATQTSTVAVGLGDSTTNLANATTSSPTPDTHSRRDVVVGAIGSIIALAFLLWGAGKLMPSSTPPTSSASGTGGAASDGVERCIKAAQAEGYDDGRCASAFISACLTGSRNRMLNQRDADRMLLGQHLRGPCPNMPSTYQEAFDRF